MQSRPHIRIMLVEQDTSARKDLRAILETIPKFTVVAEASNCDQALHHAAAQPIDLALIDIQLASLDGSALAAHLHTLHPQIAVLMLNMHDRTEEYAMPIMQAGARGYILKDAAPLDIIDAIDNVMAGGVGDGPALAREFLQTSPCVSLLTTREREVLHRIATGKTNKHIARELDLSVRTVETHRLNIKRKIGIGGKTDLIRFALEQTFGTYAAQEKA